MSKARDTKKESKKKPKKTMKERQRDKLKKKNVRSIPSGETGGIHG